MGNWLNKLFKIDKRHLARIESDAEQAKTAFAFAQA